MSIENRYISDDFKEWLIQQLEQRGWSYRQLARAAQSGASHTLTVLILDRKKPLTWDYLAAIARAFRVSPILVFLKAGFLRLEDLPFPSRLLQDRWHNTEF